MNIFILDIDPRIASEYHCDKHIVKMPLESAQLLCSAHYLSGNDCPYRPTHINHPCAKWVRESIDNYIWLSQLGKNLCAEYSFRYNRKHKCELVIDWCIENKPLLPSKGLTQFALAMPEEYKRHNPVESYRNYYIGSKSHLHSWKNRNKPFWITNAL